MNSGKRGAYDFQVHISLCGLIYRIIEQLRIAERSHTGRHFFVPQYKKSQTITIWLILNARNSQFKTQNFYLLQ